MNDHQRIAMQTALKTLVWLFNEPSTYLRSEAHDKAINALRESLYKPQDDKWPHGATIKLRWDGYGPYPETIGWAKRGKNGELVSAYSLRPLDELKWEIVEERKNTHSKKVLVIGANIATQLKRFTRF